MTMPDREELPEPQPDGGTSCEYEPPLAEDVSADEPDSTAAMAIQFS